MMNKKELGIVFLGTPEFALPSLEMLLKEGYCVKAVITQPDRQKGRGHKLLPPPVKVLAEENEIPVYQFNKISSEGKELLRELAPDLMITVAFGQILSREVLNIPKYGCINVHASLLPKYRGAAPIEMAVVNGEKKTGISTMYTVYELDAGDVLEQDETEILPEETGGELRERLSYLGAKTLKRTLLKLLDGTLKRTPQNEKEATYYPMFKKGYGQIDWEKDSKSIVDFVRGINPVPTAYSYLDDQKVKIFAVKEEKYDKPGKPGDIIICDSKKGLTVKTKDGAVQILKLQFAGSKPMNAKDLLRGRSITQTCFTGKTDG